MGQSNKVFDLTVSISPSDNSTVKKLPLRATFAKSDNSYGNGYYLSIIGREGCSFESLFDIRYESFNPNNPEPFLINWIYSNWSGENGSWDVVALKIEKVKEQTKKQKAI